MSLENQWGFIRGGLLGWMLVCLLGAGLGCKESPRPSPPPPPPVCAPLEEQPAATNSGFCKDGWCWVHPLPQGENLYGVWSPSRGVAWMVGASGTVLRAEGGRVENKPPPTSASLRDVWGSSDSDVWVVGDAGTLLHWQGQGWNVVAVAGGVGNLQAVSGTSATDAWIGGDGGALLHWDGVAWSRVDALTPSTVADLWASGTGESWVLTGDGVRRCTPSGCQPFAGPARSSAQPFTPYRIHGLSPEDVYFLERLHPDDGSIIYRWNAGTWTAIPLTTNTGDPYGHADFAALGPDDILATSTRTVSMVGETFIDHFVIHWDGSTWTSPLATDAGLAALFVSGAGEIWGVGEGGEIQLRDGQTWSELSLDSPVQGALLAKSHVSRLGGPYRDIASAPWGGAAVIGGHSRIWSSDSGELWTATLYDSFSFGQYTLVRRTTESAPATDVFETDQIPPWKGRSYPVGIHGTSPSNLWVTTMNGLYRWDGTQSTRVLELPPPENLYDSDLTGPVWVVGEEDVWLGSKEGLWHWNGQQLEQVTLPGMRVNALWGWWERDAWAVGAGAEGPRAFHWDGSQWTEVVLPAEAQGLGVKTLVDVTGRCGDEVYAMGNAGAVFRWDGTAWSTLPVPSGLTSIDAGTRVGRELWVTGAGRVFSHPW